MFSVSIDIYMRSGNDFKSLVWERVCIYVKKWRPIQSLTASLTGKTVDFTVDLDHVSLIPGLVDAWGPSGTVGLFHFSFVWPMNYINYISTIYSATWGVTTTQPHTEARQNSSLQVCSSASEWRPARSLHIASYCRPVSYQY